jgi:hypothetical protein
MYGVSDRDFSPRKACGAEEYTFFSFYEFWDCREDKTLILQRVFLCDEVPYFSIRRTITLIGVLSCGIPAVVAEVFQLFLVRVLSGPRFLRGPFVSEVVAE